MRRLLVLALACMLGGVLFASKRPPIYVAAIHGISLREAPNKASPKIETLPYGTRISNYNATEYWDSIDGYYGNWVRVALNGKDGYVFKGYTIPVQPPLTANSIRAYFSLVSGEKGVEDSVMLNAGEWMFSYRYKRFLSYSYQCDMACNYSITHLNMTIQEAYLMLYLLEYYNRGIWDEVYNYSNEDSPQVLSSSFPTEKDKRVKISTYNYFVFDTGYMSICITGVGSVVNISWTVYP